MTSTRTLTRPTTLDALALDAYARTLSDGGATLALDGHAVPTTGYVVALRSFEDTEEIGNADADTIGRYVWSHLDILSEPGTYLGTWIDTLDGTLYLDCVRIIADRLDAIAIGAQQDQLSIYCLDTGATITLQSSRTPISA